MAWPNSQPEYHTPSFQSQPYLVMPNHKNPSPVREHWTRFPQFLQTIHPQRGQQLQHEHVVLNSDTPSPAPFPVLFSPRGIPCHPMLPHDTSSDYFNLAKTLREEGFPLQSGTWPPWLGMPISGNPRPALSVHPESAFDGRKASISSLPSMSYSSACSDAGPISPTAASPIECFNYIAQAEVFQMSQVGSAPTMREEESDCLPLNGAIFADGMSLPSPGTSTLEMGNDSLCGNSKSETQHSVEHNPAPTSISSPVLITPRPTRVTAATAALLEDQCEDLCVKSASPPLPSAPKVPRAPSPSIFRHSQNSRPLGSFPADEAFATSLTQLSSCGTDKPPCLWWTLIRAAILGSPHGKLQMETLCHEIMEKFPYFHSAREAKNWKSSIRSVIHTKPCFYKTEDKNGNVWWSVDVNVDPREQRRGLKKRSLSVSEGRQFTASAIKPATRKPSKKIEEELSDLTEEEETVARQPRKRRKTKS